MITGQREPPFHIGVVEDRTDPLKIGRVRVRVVGLHTHDKTILPTEDLPWCYCIQPINSAAISGIGQAPVGPIEGTWVAVQYLDQDKQNPFVVGTLPGIAHQQTFFNNAPSQGGNYEVKPNGDVVAPWVDYSGAPVGDGKFNLAGTYRTSEAMSEKIKKYESFRSKPYDDGAGVWTIGYGTTYIDGAKVSKNTPEISEGRALELFKNDLAVVENAVKSAVAVPVTQSMFDAMVSLSYNIGGGAFRKSTVARELNARNYEKAGDHFRDWKYAGGYVVGGLEARRNDERSWFMREGLGENNDITVASAEMLAVDGSQQLVETELPVAVASLPDAAFDETSGDPAVARETKVATVHPTYPIARVLDFGSAAGVALDPEVKAAIVASGAVKILSKEEYVANIVTDPPNYTNIGGGSGGGTGDDEGGGEGGGQTAKLDQLVTGKKSTNNYDPLSFEYNMNDGDLALMIEAVPLANENSLSAPGWENRLIPGWEVFIKEPYFEDGRPHWSSVMAKSRKAFSGTLDMLFDPLIAVFRQADAGAWAYDTKYVVSSDFTVSFPKVTLTAPSSTVMFYLRGIDSRLNLSNASVTIRGVSVEYEMRTPVVGCTVIVVENASECPDVSLSFKTPMHDGGEPPHSWPNKFVVEIVSGDD